MEINHHKTSLLRELGPVDIAALQAKVAAIPEDRWDSPADYDANYNKDQALRQAQHIIFKFSQKMQQPVRYQTLPIWAEWEEVLFPIMQQAAQAYRYPNNFYPRVMLAKLPPKTFIPPHVDGDKDTYVPHKIHIPLFTNPEAYFFLQGQRFHLEEGKGYEVNNGVQHAAVNNGPTDRIHLIFELLDRDLQEDGDGKDEID